MEDAAANDHATTLDEIELENDEQLAEIQKEFRREIADASAKIHLPQLREFFVDDVRGGDEAYLGEGSFGFVLRMSSKHDPTELSAVKCVKMNRIVDAGIEARRIDVEAKLLQKLRHMNIIAFRGRYMDGAGTRQSPLLFCMVMELAEGGNLSTRIKNGGAFSKNRVLTWMLQLCAGLHHMHRECRILHRDLKPENILLDEEDCIKICDVGLACVAQASVTLSKGVGALAYMSPEKGRGKRYGEKDDMWAVGCILAELVTLKATKEYSPAGLFNALDEIAEIVQATSAHYGGCVALAVKRLLSESPTQRPSAKDTSALLSSAQECRGLYALLEDAMLTQHYAQVGAWCLRRRINHVSQLRDLQECPEDLAAHLGLGVVEQDRLKGKIRNAGLLNSFERNANM